MGAMVWFAIAAEGLVFAALLFGSAGTLAWPAAWAFLIVFLAGVLAITLMLARHDPELLAERMKPPIQADQPIWDKVIMSMCVILMLAWLMLMGLDAVRFGWSKMPVGLQILGGVVVIAALRIMYAVFRENSFLAPVVKIQSGRGHKVVSTGPYGIVRHPLYSSVLLWFPAAALMLGSWWGFVLSSILMAAVITRTALEDRTLQRELEGYASYQAKVRYRLIPLIW